MSKRTTATHYICQRCGGVVVVPRKPRGMTIERLTQIHNASCPGAPK